MTEYIEGATKARVIARGGHCFDIGDVVTLEHDDDTNCKEWRGLSGRTNYVHDNNLKIISERVTYVPTSKPTPHFVEEIEAKIVKKVARIPARLSADNATIHVSESGVPGDPVRVMVAQAAVGNISPAHVHGAALRQLAQGLIEIADAIDGADEIEIIDMRVDI